MKHLFKSWKLWFNFCAKGTNRDTLYPVVSCRCILHVYMMYIPPTVVCLVSEPSWRLLSRHPITMEDNFCLVMTAIFTSSLVTEAELGTHLESLATHRTSKCRSTITIFLCTSHLHQVAHCVLQQHSCHYIQPDKKTVFIIKMLCKM